MEAFGDEVEQATRERLDFKSELQERLARDGDTVNYEVDRRGGPAARPPLRGPRHGRGRRDRRRLREEQEGGRAGGGAACAGEAAQLAGMRPGQRATLPRSLRTLPTSMYLKAINLKGFKSFPDRTRLTFSPGVSVIVGPNGSGKSNITDAVLWAMGEQSPTAVRGQQMRDVIFAGGNGQSPRRFAEVEVVIDNTEGRAASEFSEISISRRIERNGDGEYRLNGARCRLVDIVEALADTNMGREAHSVISQGKVEQIVNSKPRDRRLLIEEAAGLGKHRKRRHNAQLKLDRTRDNLERAMDVEREARSRLRPLKRQAEAAERTAKLERRDERAASPDRRRRAARPAGAARRRPRRSWPRCAPRGTRSRSASRRCGRVARRSRSGSPPARRDAAATASSWPRRARPPSGCAPGPSRSSSPSATCAPPSGSASCGSRLSRRSRTRTPTAARIAELEAELAKLGEDASEEGARLRREAEEAEQRRAAAKAALEPLEAAAEEIGAALRQATQMHERALAEARKASERRAALAGELAAVEAKLAAAAVEGEHEALAGTDRDRLRASSGPSRPCSASGCARRSSARSARAGSGSRAPRAPPELLISSASAPTPASSEPPKDGARRLLDLIEARGDAGPDHRAPARRRLAGGRSRRASPRASPAWRSRSTASASTPAAGEIRRLPREGTDPALAARSEREELASRLAQREQTEERAKRDLERAESALAEARQREEESQSALRDARRALDEAAEEANRTSWLAERQAERSGEGSGSGAIQRAKLEAELAAERRHAEGAERAARSAMRDRAGARAADRPRAGDPAGAGTGARGAAAAGPSGSSGARRSSPRAEGRTAADVAAELRECSQEEFGLQAELREASEAMTVAEVEATQLRGQRDESTAELRAPRGRTRRAAERRDGAPSAMRSARRSRRKLDTAAAQPRADRAGQPAGEAGVRRRRASTSPSWPSSARTWSRRSRSCAR